MFFSKKQGLVSKGLYNWNRKSDLKQTTFCIYWFLTKLLNEIVELRGGLITRRAIVPCFLVYLSKSECLEQVIISYLAVISYLEQ